MDTTEWTWANLSSEQLQLVMETEQALGTNYSYILVYRPVQRRNSRAVEARVRKLQAAALTDSQIECLHGLEARLQAVAVAYTDPTPL
jgi:hypothetical protein